MTPAVPWHVLMGVVTQTDVLAKTPVRETLVAHIVAGGLAIVAGFIALFSTKGAALHRRSGTVFVYVVGAMALSGAVIALFEGARTSVIAGLLTSYLVFTAFIVFQPWAVRRTWVDVAAIVAALAIGLTSIGIGLSSVGHNPMLFIFGTVALSCGVADFRRVWSPAMLESTRISRHLWRMSFGLWIASASFFLGQAHKFFPSPLKSPLLIAVPVIVPLIAIVYWLWRVRIAGEIVPPVLKRRA
ncbi:MAG: hypothetical protein NVSMB64_12210 [Candidatus Velthaea sp.]